MSLDDLSECLEVTLKASFPDWEVEYLDGLGEVYVRTKSGNTFLLNVSELNEGDYSPFGEDNAA